MLGHNVNIYLNDILNSIKKIEDYIKDYSFESFSSKSIVVDAVLRNLEIIGEAVKKIPSGITNDYSEIEWKKIAGFRDIVIHAYGNVDLNIVWDIIKNKLPELKKTVEKMIKEQDWNYFYFKLVVS